MDEFDLIRKIFAPLATKPGAAALADDVAELDLGGRPIVTVDAIVEGVHFLSSDPIETLAAKLVAVNASDIIAKGAKPAEAVLALVWPKSRSVNEIERFAKALGESLQHWTCALIGGDTTETEGPLVLSLTMTGTCGPRGPVRRSGAQPGEDVWVTGTIGDAHAGLLAALGRLPGLLDEDEAALVRSYRLPQPPPVDAARLIAEFATASIDVSDGLLADADHIAEASGVAIDIDAALVPLSATCRRLLAAGAVDLTALLTGGDDYQSLFCAHPSCRDDLAEAFAGMGATVTRIGRVAEGKGQARILGPVGQPLDVARRGWRHVLG